MGAVGKCLGSYGSKQGQCESCPLALLCIDTAIAIDRHIDEMYALGPVPYRHGRSRAKHGDLEDVGRTTHPLRVCP